MAAPPVSLWVPIQRQCAPSVTSVESDGEKRDSEEKSGPVHRYPVIRLMVQANPGNIQLGDRVEAV